MRLWIKRIVSTAFFLGLAAAVTYAFLPKPVPVDLARVEIGHLEVSVEEDGKTRVRDRYVISSPLSGRLRRIKLRPGDRVAPGQILAAVDPADPQLLDPRTVAQSEARVKALRAALDKAGAELKSAEAAYDLAETEYGRTRQLVSKNAASPAELESKTAQKRTREEEVRKARFAEEMSRFELEQAQAALMRTRPRKGDFDEQEQFEIHSPSLSSSGRVFHVLRVREENECVVTPGTPLIELGDLSDLEVEIEVLSSDAVRIPSGAKVVLEQWGGEQPLVAQVRLVEPYGYTKVSALGVEEQRVHVIADFPEREKVPATLGDGFRVEARIIVWEKSGVLKVPTSALFRNGQGWAVFRVAERRAHRTPVTIGKKSALDAEVFEGLSEGDTVIVHPSDKVADGVEITPR
ncbi:MAG: HlyD family efflux transporter periplasmic adaptor subunit [Planctomycetes bacterium]|nr:HlyD family efflux transporter periplasmic adaptor subunit [Planctomycetota bacterium]